MRKRPNLKPLTKKRGLKILDRRERRKKLNSYRYQLFRQLLMISPSGHSLKSEIHSFCIARLRGLLFPQQILWHLLLLCVCMVYLRLLIQPKRTLIDDLAHLKMPKKSHQCQSVVFQREQGFCPLLEEDSPRVWSKSAFHVRFYSWKEPSRGFVHKRGGSSFTRKDLIGLAFRVEGTSLGSFWSHSCS